MSCGSVVICIWPVTESLLAQIPKWPLTVVTSVLCNVYIVLICCSSSFCNNSDRIDIVCILYIPVCMYSIPDICELLQPIMSHMRREIHMNFISNKNYNESLEQHFILYTGGKSHKIIHFLHQIQFMETKSFVYLY